MELKAYYRKIREVEATLPAGDVVIVSLATADGGREGLASEANRPLAARLIVDGRARAATEAEAAAYKETQKAALRAQEEAEMAHKLRLRVVAEEDYRALRTTIRELRKPKGDA